MFGNASGRTFKPRFELLDIAGGSRRRSEQDDAVARPNAAAAAAPVAQKSSRRRVQRHLNSRLEAGLVQVVGLNMIFKVRLGGSSKSIDRSRSVARIEALQAYAPGTMS